MLCAWCRRAGCECLPCCRKLTNVHHAGGVPGPPSVGGWVGWVECLAVVVSGLVLAARRAAAKSSSQCPFWNWCMRRCQSALRRILVPGGLWSSMRGRSNQSVQARTLLSGFRASRMDTNAEGESLSDAAFQQGGWPLEEKTFLLEHCFQIHTVEAGQGLTELPRVGWRISIAVGRVV